MSGMIGGGPGSSLTVAWMISQLEAGTPFLLAREVAPERDFFSPDKRDSSFPRASESLGARHLAPRLQATPGAADA